MPEFPPPSDFLGPHADVRGCVDLHMHSRCSDGAREPEYLVEWAAALGLRAISLTDHDTTRGVKAAMAAGKRLGVEVVPGCEISVKLSGGTFHLLAYFYDPDDAGFDARLREIADKREGRNRKILAALGELGMPLTYEELLAEAGEAVVGRPHIAALMERKGYVKSRQEAFDKYIANDGPAYFEKDTFGPAEALAFVRKHHAVPVLAHPYWLNRGSLEATEAYLAEMKDLGLAGIEVIYPDHDEHWTRGLLAIAERLGLLVTGGSDYHGGRTKPHTTLGHGEGGGFRVPAELLDKLRAAARS
ncbi:MAG: PHP domain-containing protein [Planctomycetes bacterium]|nr:PHP domain-containing protein [Planctomycetota bacterium]MCW8135719.1 PHP domain-containing protein [Planctomycetota bacterium]